MANKYCLAWNHERLDKLSSTLVCVLSNYECFQSLHRIIDCITYSYTLILLRWWWWRYVTHDVYEVVDDGGDMDEMMKLMM